MNFDSNQLHFSKAFLTSLFAGLIATLVCLTYDIWYRLATFYGPTEFINVSSIIIIVNILLMTAGLVYYAFLSWSRKGDLIYTVFILIVFGFCIWETSRIHRFVDLKLNREFIELLLGTIIIVGISSLLIPFIYHRKRIVDLFYDANV